MVTFFRIIFYANKFLRKPAKIYKKLLIQKCIYKVEDFLEEKEKMYVLNISMKLI